MPQLPSWIDIRRKANVLGKSIGWWITLVIAALTLSPAPAIASSPPPTVISLETANELIGGPLFEARTGMRYSFNASVTRPPGSPGAVDLYLGVIAPGGAIATWSPGITGPALTTGLVPLAQSITTLTFNSSVLLGQEARYTFSGTEPPGMYLIFALVVAAGFNPSGHWIAATLVPLIYQP